MTIASMSPPRSKTVCIVDMGKQETKCGDPSKGYRPKPGEIVTCPSCLTVAYSAERDNARKERDEALAALAELVRLKDLHDDIELRERHGELVRSFDPAKVDYRNNKPKAWLEARRLAAPVEKA